jgi:hypothetical protein
MSELRLSYPASVIAGKSRLVPADILFLRKHAFPDGLISPDDAAQLLAIHQSCAEKCAEWDNWFIEMMTSFIVFHSWPQYSLDDINAAWLIAMFSREGVIETGAELELILHVMEVSRAVPPCLSALALDQLQLALSSGEGAYAGQRQVRRAGIAREDIDYLYRILRGSTFEGKMVLSATEATVLDRIDKLVRGRTNHPAWYDLVQSIDKRDADGHATAQPWLRMIEATLAHLEAA